MDKTDKIMLIFAVLLLILITSAIYVTHQRKMKKYEKITWEQWKQNIKAENKCYENNFPILWNLTTK